MTILRGGTIQPGTQMRDHPHGQSLIHSTSRDDDLMHL